MSCSCQYSGNKDYLNYGMPWHSAIRNELANVVCGHHLAVCLNIALIDDVHAIAATIISREFGASASCTVHV